LNVDFDTVFILFLEENETQFSKTAHHPNMLLDSSTWDEFSENVAKFTKAGKGKGLRS